VSKLNPSYKLPSRKHFSQQEIPRLYYKVKESIMPKLHEIDPQLIYGPVPYLSYTVLFINRNWEMTSFCQETVPLFEDYTGINISEHHD